MSFLWRMRTGNDAWQSSDQTEAFKLLNEEPLAEAFISMNKTDTEVSRQLYEHLAYHQKAVISLYKPVLPASLIWLVTTCWHAFDGDVELKYCVSQPSEAMELRKLLQDVEENTVSNTDYRGVLISRLPDAVHWSSGQLTFFPKEGDLKPVFVTTPRNFSQTVGSQLQQPLVIGRASVPAAENIHSSARREWGHPSGKWARESLLGRQGERYGHRTRGGRARVLSHDDWRSSASRPFVCSIDGRWTGLRRPLDELCVRDSTSLLPHVKLATFNIDGDLSTLFKYQKKSEMPGPSDSRTLHRVYGAGKYGVRMDAHLCRALVRFATVVTEDPEYAMKKPWQVEVFETDASGDAHTMRPAAMTRASQAEAQEYLKKVASGDNGSYQAVRLTLYVH